MTYPAWIQDTVLNLSAAEAKLRHVRDQERADASKRDWHAAAVRQSRFKAGERVWRTLATTPDQTGVVREVYWYCGVMYTLYVPSDGRQDGCELGPFRECDLQALDADGRPLPPEPPIEGHTR